MTKPAAIFRTYLLQGLEYVEGQVITTEGQLSDETVRHAFHLLKYAFKYEDAWNSLRELLLKMAPKVTLSEIPEDWEHCLSQALEAGKSKNDIYLQGKLHVQSGFIDQRNNKLAEAKAHYRQAIKCFDSIGNTREYAWALSRLANIQRMSKQFMDAQLALDAVIQVLPADDPYLVLTYMVLGWVAYDKSDWVTSYQHFEHALQLSRKVGDKQRESQLLRDIGSVLQMQSKFEQAIEHYQQAVEIQKALHHEYDLAITEMNLGVVYLFTENWSQALEWLENAHTRFHKYNDLYYLGTSYTNQGIAYRNLKQAELAIGLFEESIQLFDQIDDKYLAANALDELGVTQMQLHNISSAKLAFEKALNKLQLLSDTYIYRAKIAEINGHLQDCLNFESLKSSEQGERERLIDIGSLSLSSN